MDANSGLVHNDGQTGGDQSWQVAVDSPQRFSTPSAIDSQDTNHAYTSSAAPPNMGSTYTSTAMGLGVQLADTGQHFHSNNASFQPVFVSSANYDTRIEDYTSLVSGMSLPTSMATLQHLQQVLQQAASDRKNLPPHLQVVPLFDPGSTFGAIPRNISVGQVSMATSLGSLGIGLNSMSNANMIGGTTVVSQAMTQPTLSTTTLDTREQLLSHSVLLGDGIQNNQNMNLQNGSQLFPMVEIGGNYRTQDGGQDPGLLMQDAESEHNLHLALTEATRKHITDSFNAAVAEDASSSQSPTYSHLQPARHYQDAADAFQAQSATDHLGMTATIADRMEQSLHQAHGNDGVMGAGMSNERMLTGSHDSTTDLSGGGLMQSTSSGLHMMSSVERDMLGLNQRHLHDTMVGAHSSDDDDDDDDDLTKQAGGRNAAGIYDSNDNDLFIQQTRKSQRLAEREHSPSPVSRPYYMPKNYYSINEIWCEDCQTGYAEECHKHKQSPLYDKVVFSRAWATLPSLLQIFRLGETTDLGVFAKKPIAKRTKFGPFYAPLVETHEQVTNKRFLLKLENEDGSQYFLEPSDENNCNWMMFVRPAENYAEMNAVAYQYKMDIFYVTTKHIETKQEIKVWYAAPYATRMGAQPMRPSQAELEAMDPHNKWPCYECNKSFRSSALLQKHLMIHDETSLTDTFNDDDIMDDDDSVMKGKRKSRSGRGKSRKMKDMVGEENTVFQSWKKRKTNMYLNKIKKYREPIKRSLMTLYKKLGKDSGGNEWVCTHCDLTFDNPSLLNLHTLTHAAEDLAAVDLNSAMANSIHSDQTVNLMFNDNGAGGSHQILSSLLLRWDENNLKCPVCHKVFATKQELILHASEHAKRGRRALRIHPRKPFKCLTCWKSFTSEERLQKHMLCHSDNTYKPFSCDKCEKRFMNNSALACHMKTHSDQKYYECPICHLGFDQIYAMKEHIPGHAVNGMYDCPECHKTFADYKMVRRHVNTFHSNRRYPCPECDKDFSRPDKLKMHKLKHSNHREFMCETCGRQFKRKDKLTEHVKRMHNPQRVKMERANQNVNPSPPKKFLPKVEPNDFSRFIYKCHMCMLGFKRRGMLVNHIAKRHPEMKTEDIPELNLPILRTNRDYFCQYCDKVYKSSSKRKLHILKYHPGGELPPSLRAKAELEELGVDNASYSQPGGSVTTMPHSCELCHKQYASKAKLLQHQRKKHADHDNERRRIQIPISNSGEITMNPALLDKSRLYAALIQKPFDNLSTEVITITPQTMHNLEGLQGTDLLTQAMSELSEIRTQSHHMPGTTIEYQLAGVVPSVGTATLLQPGTLQQQHTIELSNIGHLGQVQRPQETQVLQSVGSSNSQMIRPISVVTSAQAAQMLANAIPGLGLGSQYLQKGATINWTTAQNIQNYR